MLQCWYENGWDRVQRTERMTPRSTPSRRLALSGLVALAILSLAFFSSCEVPRDPFKDGQEQKVHDQGMYPERALPDTAAKDRMDTVTAPSMDGKP